MERVLFDAMPDEDGRLHGIRAAPVRLAKRAVGWGAESRADTKRVFSRAIMERDSAAAAQ